MLSRFVLSSAVMSTLIISSCSPAKSVTRKVVNQKYYDLSFSPVTITRKIVGYTEITVVPIDAQSLNKEMYDASKRDGNYAKEINSIMEALNERISHAGKQQKIYLQGKINAFEYLSKLEKQGKISSGLALLLKRKINEERSGYDGTEFESLADTEIFTNDSYNPYKSSDKYFSVFHLTFENKGTEVEKINLKEFQILSNEEQLYPLTSDYFESMLRYNAETVKNAYRMNMPAELILTPGQKVIKYLAVPAINSENTKLQVQFIRDKNVVNFDYSVARKEIDKNYTLEDYTLDYRGEGNEFTYKTFYIVSYKDNVSYALKDPKLFVSNEKKSLPASIYAIGINTDNSEIVYAAEENFKFATTENNKKQINFRRIRKDKETNKY